MWERMEAEKRHYVMQFVVLYLFSIKEIFREKSLLMGKMCRRKNWGLQRWMSDLYFKIRLLRSVVLHLQFLMNWHMDSAIWELSRMKSANGSKRS